MKPLFLALSLLAGPLLARANDASFEGVAGTALPLRGENAAIRMVSERVILTANPADFSTDATFIFRNETRKRLQVPMGFPEGNYGDVASAGPLVKTGFTMFASFVDERKVPVKRVVLGQDAAEIAGFDTYWRKTVEFGPLQTRRVRVVARSPYGGRSSFGLLNCLSYDFSGQNWRSSVARSDLEIRVPRQGLWMAVMEAEMKPLDFKIETGSKIAVLRRSWTNWPAKLSVSVGLQRAIPFWIADAKNVSGANDRPFFQSAQTFRVGAQPQTLENYDLAAPDGFNRNGVTYTALNELKGYAGAELTYNAKTRAATLAYSAKKLVFTLGSSQIQRVQSGKTETFALPAPPLLLRGADESTFYVPIHPTADLLGLNARADLKARLLTISRRK